MIEWSEGGTIKQGTVALVYTDALASGTNDYVPVTNILVKIGDTTAVIRPREITRIYGLI